MVSRVIIICIFFCFLLVWGDTRRTGDTLRPEAERLALPPAVFLAAEGLCQAVHRLTDGLGDGAVGGRASGGSGAGGARKRAGGRSAGLGAAAP